ncbi:MAG: hypothetical protein M3Y87_33025 [Myxococcota bacterium]|nr:hypothetical protein [Myxococcota bacterium]
MSRSVVSTFVVCLVGCATSAGARVDRPLAPAEPTARAEASEERPIPDAPVAVEAEPSRAPSVLELLAGSREQRCAALFSGSARRALTSPPQDLWDPEGPSPCFEGPVRGCPPNHRCESGRAGAARIVLAVLDPSEAGHEVRIAVLVSRPARGFCDVLPRPVVRLAGGPGGALGVQDLDGDGRAELLWPRAITIRNDASEAIAELVVLHPYVLEGDDLVLRPALGAAWYAREAEMRERALAREIRDCEGAEDTARRGACAPSAIAERLLIDALRGAASCSGAERDAIASR